MSTVHEFKDTAELIAKFDELNATGDFFIVYLTGGIDEASGKSWCPDCDNNRPAINDGVITKTTLTVLKGVVDDRNEWVGVTTHPWRTHPIIKAGGVPSLCLVKEGMVLMRAENDDEFANAELLSEIANPQ